MQYMQIFPERYKQKTNSIIITISPTEKKKHIVVMHSLHLEKHEKDFKQCS